MAHEPAWYKGTLRRIFFDMHLPDWSDPGQSDGTLSDKRDVASRFDPKAIVQAFVKARINLAVIFAKCQYGNFYYPTKLGRQHQGLGQLDFLGEILSEAKKHDIRVIGYYSNMWDTRTAREHPEWMGKNAEGQTSYNRWPRLCLNSPYRQRVHDHLKEMFTLYDLDGVWSDILTDLPCFCERCQDLYEEQVGGTMPRSSQDPNWIRMVRWQQNYLYDYLDGCRNVVKTIKPDAAFIINFFGTPYAKPSQGLSFKHLPLSDIGSTEGYSEWHGLLFPSYATRYMRSGMMGKSFEVLISRFINTWDFTVRPLAQMRFEAFSVAANGGAVSVDDEPYHDGTLESEVFNRIEAVYQEIEKREPYLLESKPYPFAAIYHSQKMRELDEVLNRSVARGTSLLPSGNPNPSDADLLPSLMGTFKALLESHIPVEVVDDRLESLQTLSQYKVVYMPNILTLSEAEADLLRAYVLQGGGLVATGGTSLYDENGNKRNNFLLAHLFGIDFLERDTFTFPYFGFKPSSLAQGVGNYPLPHYMAMWRVKPNADVSIAATRIQPLIETKGEIYYHNNLPSPANDTGQACLVYREVGKGRVVYCAGLPENNFARLGHAPYRQLIKNMTLWATNAEPPVKVEGLLNTELVVNILGDDLIVHLISANPLRTVQFGPDKTPEIIEEAAVIHNVTLTIPATTTQVYQIPTGEEVKIQRLEQTTVFLEHLSDWETLCLVGAAKERKGD
jgi:Hypothetical glycosyl hydrolase 6/Beta-galactosidase trimerisation domain